MRVRDRAFGPETQATRAFTPACLERMTSGLSLHRLPMHNGLPVGPATRLIYDGHIDNLRPDCNLLRQTPVELIGKPCALLIRLEE